MNQIGISKEYSTKVNQMLNAYLSNVQVTYMNVRGYHWNIIGNQFFRLHEKFEEVYDTLNEMADEIAERILMLEGNPVHAFSKYLKLATIKEKENINSADDTVRELLNEFRELLKNEREILEFAADNGDEGTVDLMNGYITAQEKLIWMLNASLK